MEPTRSVYELWFEFLKEANPDKFHPVVAERLKKITKKTTYKIWWAKHAHLFEEHEPLAIQVMVDTHDFIDYADDDEYLLLAVPLTSSRELMREQFSALLQEYHPNKGGAPKWELGRGWGDFFYLARRPNIESLEKALKVHRALKENQKRVKKRTKYEIEEDLQLIKRESKMVKNIETGKWLRKDLFQNDKTDLHNAQIATVWRYAKQAEMLIANVEQGVFPVNDVLMTFESFYCVTE